MFLHACDPAHRVVVCYACRSCVAPGPRSQERHLRGEPHRLLGATLSTTVQLLSSYRLRTVEELKEAKPQFEDKCQLIENLESYDGFRCLQAGCAYCTRHLPKIKRHVASAHNLAAKGHKEIALWEECTLQTYFTGKGRIDYFVVVGDDENNKNERELINGLGQVRTPLKEEEKDLFIKLESDYQDVKGDFAEQAGIVQDFGDSRSAREPWLDRTGFLSHLAGLRDEEIRSSYQLPRMGKGGDDDEEADPTIARVVRAAEAVLRDAYALCSDRSPERKMTQQRANILNEFYAGASGRSDGFRYYKNASTLVKYFATFKQLLAYVFRVAVTNENGEDRHFTRSSPEQRLPGQVIRLTARQEEALQDIAEALEEEEQEGE